MLKNYSQKENKRTIKLTSLVVVLAISFFSIQQLSAQPCPPGPGGVPDCSNQDPSGVPFDGGASLLLGGGIVMGAKRLYGKIRKRK
jgi:hypothetical protein